MKKSYLYFLASFSMTGLLLAGCSKKNDDPAPTMKNIAGTYKFSSFSAQVGSNKIDLLAQLDACQRDDLFTLKEDSTLLYIDAGTKCTPPGDGQGKWSVKGNTFDLDGDQYTIKSFSGSSLVITAQETQGGITGTVTGTLTKQ